MRRIGIALMSTLSGLVLLFSYHTSLNQGTAVAAGTKAKGTGTTTTGGGSAATGGTTSGSTGTGSTSGSASGSGSTTKTTTSGSSGQYTGDAVDTRWGPVQVQITVENGKITAADAVVVPSGNGRDVEINNYAVPILNQEAVSAQSAQIDAISGATVTSDGYVSSLQSAIDQAHLG